MISTLRRGLWVAGLVLVGTTGMAQESPVDVVTSAADELSTALRERRGELEANRAELYALINEILDPRFDRRYAAQLVLAKAWRSANDEQRTAFIDAFYQTLMRKYADGVLQFDEDRLRVLPFRGKDDAKRATVKTEVTLDDGSTIPVNYGLVRRSSGWKVYDVTIEGISYVRNFRTEIAAEIDATSLDAVIARLQASAAPAGDTSDADPDDPDAAGAPTVEPAVSSAE